VPKEIKNELIFHKKQCMAKGITQSNVAQPMKTWQEKFKYSKTSKE
jgi:hypothetical protein